MPNESEKLKPGKYYPVMDRIPFEDRERLQLPKKSKHGDWDRMYSPAPSLGMGVPGVHARWDGKPPRCPKKGEWYLSGSTIEAYRAPNDLTTPFHIAELKQTVTNKIGDYEHIVSVEAVEIVEQAQAMAEELKAKGWTKADFARALKKMLESDTGNAE